MAPAGAATAFEQDGGARDLQAVAAPPDALTERIERLEATHAPWLDAAQRGRLAGAVAAIARAAEYARLVAWWSEARGRGDDPSDETAEALARPLRLRRDARRALELCPRAHRGDWEAAERRAEAALAAAVRPLVVEGEAAASLTFDDAARELPVDHAAVWLTADATTVVVPSAFGDWFFLRWVDVATGAVRRAVSLRLPGSRGLFELLVEDERLALLTRRGDVVHLTPDGTRVLDFVPLSEGLGATAEVEGGLLLPGGRHVWISLRPSASGGPARAVVGDLAQRRLVDALEDAPKTWFLPDPGGGLVARGLADGRVVLHAPSGRRSGERMANVTQFEDVRAVARWPSGRRLMSLVRGYRQDLQVLGRDPGENLSLPDSSPDRKCVAASSRAAGATFAVYRPEDVLHATVAALTDWPELRWTCAVDERTTLLTDVDGVHVAALVCAMEGAAVARLEADAPPPLEAQVDVDLDLEALRRPCCPTLLAADAATARSLAKADPQARAAALSRVLAAGVEAPELVSLLRAMAAWPELVEERARLAFWAVEHFPGHDEVRVAAIEAAIARPWEGCEALLPDGPPVSAHAAHVEGLLRLHREDVDGALARWRAALECPSDAACPRGDLRALIDLVRGLHRGEPDAPLPRGASLVTRRAVALRRADDAFQAGDWPAVVRELDIPAFWRLPLAPDAARLVEAWIGIDPEDAAGRWRARLACATFLAVRRGEGGRQAPGTAERIEAMTERAGAWLARGAGGQ
jgi:hypothetical protein